MGCQRGGRGEVEGGGKDGADDDDARLRGAGGDDGAERPDEGEAEKVGEDRAEKGYHSRFKTGAVSR